ncbi:MAG: MarR family winged helix-turn-helix transcriptional regulator, partial [Lachnospiraceae bacterium]|nr:MarR family winged helix-turn-helix transcriptional regulator [Lachnospiraceae bacterium]
MDNQTDIGKYINKLYNRLRRNFWKEREQFGLTAAQGNILSYILLESETTKLYQKDIEKEFDLRPSTATELLQALEKKALIKRINDEKDGRYKVLHATPKAQSLRESLQEAIHAKEATLTKGISMQELEHFMRTAEKMLWNLEQLE